MFSVKTFKTEYEHNRFVVQGGVRLTSKDGGGGGVWADNISSSRLARSATSSFANNVAKSLEKALIGNQQK